MRRQLPTHLKESDAESREGVLNIELGGAVADRSNGDGTHGDDVV